MDRPSDQSTVGPSGTPANSSVTAIAGSLLVGVVSIYWFGWTLLHIGMWIAVALALSVAGFCGYRASRAKNNDERVGLSVCCGGGLLIAAIVWIVIPSKRSDSIVNTDVSLSNHQQALSPSDLRQVLIGRMQAYLDQRKQEVFNAFHPTGTAKRVVVHDLALLWKPGSAKRDAADVMAFTTRFTLYWTGPLTEDGYTKVSATYDLESDRFTQTEILTTNGLKNEQLAEMVGFGLGVFLRSQVDGAAK